MTETLQRPVRPEPPRRPATGEGVRASAVAGALTAVRAAVVGLVAVALPVLLVWATDARGGAGAAEALRTGGQLWLVAHGASLEVPGGAVGLTPLGLVALPAWLLLRAARRTARSLEVPDPRAAARLALATAVPYALLAGVVALVCSTGDVRAPVLPALLWSLGLALLAGGAGALLGSEERPAPLSRIGRAVAVATGVLLGAGALLAGLALALDLPQAAALARAGDPGAVGGLALLTAGVALVPNAAVWGATWLAGPGFAVGVGTAVGPFGHELGPVPSLPLLAALPASPASGVAVLALVVPVVAGLLAGRLVVAAGALRTALGAVAVGAGTGVALGLLAWLSGGPVGGVRLARVGPAALDVTLAVSALVGVAAVASALLARHRARA